MKFVYYSILNILLYWSFQPAMGSEIINISEINGETPTNPGNISIEYGAIIEIKGTVENLPDTNNDTSKKYLVQIIVNRLYDNSWWVAGSTQLKPASKTKERTERPASKTKERTERPASKTKERTERASDTSSTLRGQKIVESKNQDKKINKWDWNILNIRLDSHDLGKGYKIKAVLVESNKELTEGIIDYQKIHKLAESDLIQVILDSRKSYNCSVSIKEVLNNAGEMVKVDKIANPIPVALGTTFKGEATKPSDADLRLIVKPELTGNIWIQDTRITIGNDGTWQDLAFCGEMQKEDEKCQVQAVVFNKPIDSNSCKGNSSISNNEIKLGESRTGCTANEWQKIEKDNICAQSTIIPVIRGKSRPDITISKIDNDDVEGKTFIELRGQQHQIEGKSRFSDLSDGEMVFLLVLQSNQVQWTVKFRAFPSRDGKIWQLPILNFEKPGRYTIMAVVTKENNLNLNDSLKDEEWFKMANTSQINRWSKLITIEVKDEDSKIEPIRKEK
ncbi:MAG: hypothetical protein U1F76_24915 [Candidatus Competibacteraceae bacterium]